MKKEDAERDAKLDTLRTRIEVLEQPPTVRSGRGFDAVRYTRALVAKIKGRIDPLEARIAALESRPELKYCGTFAPGATYAAGSLVSRSGGMWFATLPTSDIPGQSTAWRLVVKSGHA